MENLNAEQNIDNAEQIQSKIEQSQYVNVADTAIEEYFDIIKSEYETERNKKQSFESRAGLIMALLGAICIFLFEKVQLKDIFSLMTVPLTFLDFAIILSGLGVYVCFLFTMLMIIKTITIKQHDNFEVRSIDEALLREHRLTALCKIIFTYRDIIIQHRTLNELRAKDFRKSLYGISATLIFVIVFITIKK